MTITGTSHFVSMTAAIRYYDQYGCSVNEVETKLADGEIHIGKPDLKPGQTLSVIPNEGRYQITDHG